MAAQCAMLSRPAVAAPARATAFTGLSRTALPAKAVPSFAQRTVSNGIKTRQMMVWQPTGNKYFETLSYLPPLSDDEIGKQVDYITRNGWTPCLEFAEPENAYVADNFTVRFSAAASGYADNRYWTMFKLPMFGCNDSSQVLREVANCVKSFPTAYVRLVAFDATRQVQCAGFLVHRPKGNDYAKVEDRSK